MTIWQPSTGSCCISFCILRLGLQTQAAIFAVFFFFFSWPCSESTVIWHKHSRLASGLDFSFVFFVHVSFLWILSTCVPTRLSVKIMLITLQAVIYPCTHENLQSMKPNLTETKCEKVMWDQIPKSCMAGDYRPVMYYLINMLILFHICQFLQARAIYGLRKYLLVLFTMGHILACALIPYATFETLKMQRFSRL